MWLDHVGLAQPIGRDRRRPEHRRGDPRGPQQRGSSLQAELRLSLDFYAAQEGAAPVDKVVLSGPGITIPGFAEALRTGFHLPFESRVPAALRGFDARPPPASPSPTASPWSR